MAVWLVKCIQDSEESNNSPPHVMLVSTDGQFLTSGIQLDGQPTCAVVVSRDDYHRTIALLKDEEINNLSYFVEDDSQVCYFINN